MPDQCQVPSTIRLCSGKPAHRGVRLPVHNTEPVGLTTGEIGAPALVTPDTFDADSGVVPDFSDSFRRELRTEEWIKYGKAATSDAGECVTLATARHTTHGPSRDSLRAFPFIQSPAPQQKQDAQQSCANNARRNT
jgi:hypothetical protein